MAIRLTFVCAPGGDATLGPLLGDAPLSEQGLRMARAARAALPAHATAVRAPSVRCAQTADAFGVTAAAEPELRDVDLGAWCGRTVGDLAATDPDGFTAWLTDPDAAPHGGESVRRFCRRTANWLRDLPSDTGSALAVTEAAVVRAALIHALALPERSFWHLAVPPLSAATLTRRGGGWDVGFGHVTPRKDQRWVLSRSATLVCTDGDPFAATARVGGEPRPGISRETVPAGSE
ncbi:Broad specificity phosphatase PhoE [Streptomyces sp. 1222.5]|uniref:histidine phosphatase family protein n=1 Tax=unclassified Streptomyces TaxID=2593676 RepID=UPI00089A3EC1|nr:MULTISPECIES: histidine phosphatase family protein [unclassified Streptomyces]PKW11717.1 broad specificity phosphatase PhoE [Streptomyces sp. 5112.2]SEB71724.1 Broad specificity phosphatase PhoE [Streptomyces sp. 1222.5]SEE18923.1 Broad specificity phosphatase PhoE [Streptomyces sp. 2231.1]